VLAKAAGHGMQSLAMPLIGAGLAGWPAKLAAQNPHFTIAAVLLWRRNCIFPQGDQPLLLCPVTSGIQAASTSAGFIAFNTSAL